MILNNTIGVKNVPYTIENVLMKSFGVPGSPMITP